MLRPGDRVSIEGTGEDGFVSEVHTHDVVVRVRVAGGYDERRYPHESLRFTPVMRETSQLHAY
jgi:hypothetical protein